MIRPIVHVLSASALLASFSLAPLTASPLPDDKEVGTWVLLPLVAAAGGSASGTATIQVDVRARKICYAIDAAGVADIAEIHLSKGAGKSTGTSIAKLRKSLRGPGWDNCVEIDPSISRPILANPSDYYVDIRTSAGTSALQARLAGSGKTLER